MKYYQKIEFVPSMKLDKDSCPDEKREAWLEEVACAILNHTKEDCCLKVRQVLEMLVEANRADLLTGSKDKYYSIDQLVGGATKKMRSLDEVVQINQITVVRCEAWVPTTKREKPRIVDLYYFLLNPDEVSDLHKKGTLPKSKW
ncbi:hypothetical protein PDESU_00420 [Pontiella desulfatans]|uniref:Uncharacterized protein n=1 Tax=Pontiella desulfatans TaxID=2750659 RepID=A0A6C2TW98_PONDE|nr:hypothetical protein [Pontiella desulfatans]VGO11873.1 hypothetical protein PDESU_00420 [Pontiella desulfatans]